MHIHTTVAGKLQFSLLVTVIFIVVEFIGAVQADSLALLSDAGHNFTDALALGLAWFAVYLQSKPPNKKKTFGYHRAGVLAAFINALALVFLALFIFYESYERLLNPRVVQEQLMIYIAAAGLIVNLLVMKALHGESREDLNIRGAFMHMFGDALSSIGVIIGGIVLIWKDWLWIDPTLSILIGFVILWSGWGIARESLNILLEGHPQGITHDDIFKSLLDLEGVLDIHDLHVWSLSSSSHALSCHVLIEDQPPSRSKLLLDHINELLAKYYQIHHTTVQFEHTNCIDLERSQPNLSARLCSAVHTAEQ